MAEVHSLVASVVRVIQLSEAVDKTASRYLHMFQGAQSVLVPVMHRLCHLHVLFSTLRLELVTSKASALQHLLEPLQTCESMLWKLNRGLSIQRSSQAT